MKKRLIMLLLFVFALASCDISINNSNGSNNDNNDDSNNNNVETEVKDNKLLLGSYGDYVAYVDDSLDASLLSNEYDSLIKVTTNRLNNVYESKYQKGLLSFFDINNKIKITINIDEEEINKLNEDHKISNKESYRICDLDIIYDGLLFHYEDVGIRQKGNTSRGEIVTDGKINLRHYKLNFSETFDDEYRKDVQAWKDKDALEYRKNRTFFGLEKLNIRWNRNQDATYLKEYYAYETYRANNVLAPRSNLMNVVMKIGNEESNLGVYLGIEDINKNFLKRNLTTEAYGGDLYKLGWSFEGARLDNANFSLIGIENQVFNNGSYYQEVYPYDLKTNKKTSTHESLKTFINKAINTSVDEYNTFFGNDTYYDSVISYFALSYLLGDPDDLRGNYNNTYMYFTLDSNQALFIPTDNDRSYASTGGSNPTGHNGVLSNPFDNNVGYANNDSKFFEKSIFENGNNKIKEDYVNRIKEIIDNGYMEFDKFNKIYQIAYNNYQNDINLSSNINYNNIDFCLVESSNYTENWNLSMEIYLKTKVETFNNFLLGEKYESSNYYFRGEINGWNGIESKYNLKIIDGIPTISLYLDSNKYFKIADSNWTKSFAYSDLLDKELFESVGDHDNIRVKESGNYIIKVIEVDGVEVIVINKA